ncbi:hypothetical protein KZZ52_52945 [Dactylosporangium sp. AC04546]|uniref:hypothetical protein n=1 Tax=Dactylosporangium sp. AC04546 TaxID=2862460 RepID=UPI001EDF1104|nr:hypothetical protein [Dactylosporangium sp. AC04546]WVK82563.1 hypothetical protein KZZ52_52945 [Dactylosporangium sp. AC04546]
MRLPQPFDYKMALQAPTVSFLDEELRRCDPRRDPLGMPASVAGGFAVTFDVAVERHRYAVRCFYRQGNHLQQRYAAVAKFVRDSRLPFLVEVDYLDAGIRVGTDVYPVVRMPWVDGARLDDWIDDHLDDPHALNRVRRNIADAVAGLRGHDAAHGDLQHGNILVRPDGAVRLVDYDGMYLPALRGYGAAEQGHRNYQHPERRTQFDATLDLFAAHVIDLSLAGLIHEPGLWRELNKNNGEGLLFSAGDFADPGSSPAFARLAAIPPLAEPARRLHRACEAGFDGIAAALAGEPVSGSARGRSSARPGGPQPLVLQATDRAGLLAHQGDEATVVGRVLRTKTIQRTGTITFLNFGDFRRGAFTVVAWERGHRDLVRAFGSPEDLDGKWVSVTGLLSIFEKGGVRTPQIELPNARAVRVLTGAQATALLASAATAPGAATGASARAASTAAGGPVAGLDDQLSQLYTSTGFTSRLGGATGATAATPPAAGPASPPPRQSTPPPRRPTPPPRQPSTGRTPPGRPFSPPPGPSSAPPHSGPPYSGPPYGGPSRPTGPPWPGRTPAPHQRPDDFDGIGLIAVAAALFLGPAGLMVSVYAMSRERLRHPVDRVAGVVAIPISILWMLYCCCVGFNNFAQGLLAGG